MSIFALQINTRNCLEPPNYLQISFSTFTAGHTLELCLVLVLLVISALISATEVAYFSLSPQHIDKFKNTDTKRSRRILKHLSRPNDLLSTILLYNNLVNIAIILLSTYIINSVIDFSQAPTLGFLIEIVALTFMLAFFGEITPKMVAAQYPERIANLMAIPLQVLIKISRPFNRLTMHMGSTINKRFGNRSNISIADLSQAVDIADSASAEDKKILKGIVRYVNIDVKSIMIPRVQMTAIEIHSSFAEARRQMVESDYSRIPVYDKTLDNICGFLSVKDFLPHIEKDEQFQWQHLIRAAYFVPEQKKINDLLEEFRQKKIHLAIVVDEFGGTEGLVTLEDILEEIVGEISDETD